MTISWPSLLRTARRLVRLTQEDFAADLGRSQSMVALWEAGRRPLPPAVRRRVLDILAGYYHRRPEYGALLSRAVASRCPVTLYRQGMIIEAGNAAVQDLWRERRLDLVGTCILPLFRSDLRVAEILDSYVMPMLDGTSEVLSISFNDRSVVYPDVLVRRTNTVYRVGEGRLLSCEDVLYGRAPGTALPPADLRILTADDIADAAAG
ncbi:MAG TPA: helix-turn-helix transcriptional regulator [Azospirillum sp.]